MWCTPGQAIYPEPNTPPPVHHDNYRAALALRHTPGLGPRCWKQLAEAYPTLTDAARDAKNWPARKLANPRVANAFRERQ